MKNNVRSNFPKGVITATLTPLNSDGHVDHHLLADHCHGLLKRGGHGIALLGTTGEANSFSAEERKTVLEKLIVNGFDAKRMIVGTGTCSLTETVSLTKHAVEAGTSGVLLMPPFYYRDVNEEGLFRYFAKLINEVASNELRIFLYHFPRLSGIDMSLDLLKKLKAEFPKVIAGIKDSGGNLEHMQDVIKAIPDLIFYAGSEKFMADVVRQGGAGCISATTNFKIEAAAAVYQDLLDGQNHTQNASVMIQYRESFEGYNFAVALKSVLARKQNHSAWKNVRLPLTPLIEADVNKILEKINEIGN